MEELKQAEHFLEKYEHLRRQMMILLAVEGMT